MSLKFYLPVGKPDLVQSQSDADEFRQTLQHNGVPFAGDQVWATYCPPSPAAELPVDYCTTVALTGGFAHYDPFLKVVRLELMFSAVNTLETILGDELPIPIRFTFGPVTANFTGNKQVAAGETLGELDGVSFNISMQDQNHFYLDPSAYFQLFNQHNLWNLPSGVRCPLIPATYPPTFIDGQINVAGPDPVASSEPFLSISGGSLGLVVHNPPNPLPTHYFSFLSNDTITTSVTNLGADQTAALRFKDVSQQMYHTKINTGYVDLADANEWSIIPQDELKPYHKSYKKENGKKSVGEALTYQLKITVSNPSTTLSTTISQDQKDIIRQEYLFHSKPFQSGNTVLAIPERQQLERNHKPNFVEHFKPYELQRSNYNAKNGNWMLNRREVYHVAEYMRRQFADRLVALEIAGTLSEKITSYGLAVTSSWRNPERNERVNGVRNSNHQFGRALDLRSSHFSWKNSFTEERRTLQLELFNVGYEFLADLIQLNGGVNCGSVEILLERGPKLLWSYRALGNNSIESKKGSKYTEVVGTAPSDNEGAIRKAARHASHIHIGWKPTDPETPLILPDIQLYDDIAPSLGNVFRNIILIADEDASVDANDQLPLNHIASSIKRHLEKIYPDTPTDIHVVRSALDFLKWCNAFRTPTYRIRYFFSFSHAWPGGLKLTNYDDDVDYIQLDGSSDPQIHDAELYQLINFKYADLRAREDTEFDFLADEEDYHLKWGPDDFNEIRTHQMRISNLRYLPQEAKDNMFHTFADAEGIYIVGCRTADLPDVPEPSFCQELANLLQKTVYGAAYYSKVFKFGQLPPEMIEPMFPMVSQQGQGWQQVDLSRTDPEPDPKNPVVLVPGTRGGYQYLYYRAFLGRDDPDIADFPETVDLLRVYEEMLTPCYPKSED